jgi:biotin carboxyl carrier protein
METAGVGGRPVKQGNLFTAAIYGKILAVNDVDEEAISIDGVKHRYSWNDEGNGFATLGLDNRTIRIYCRQISETLYEIWFDTQVLTVELQDEKHQILSKLGAGSARTDGPFILRAPMPGLVKVIEASAGQQVEKGSGLVILEAMKMENELRSTLDGVIKSVHVNTGQAVEKDQPLMTIEPRT